MNKIVAIVPARGGSQSIPYKNIIEFNGKPLIWWTLMELINTPEIYKIVVSTDSLAVATVVNRYFMDTVKIVMRPDEISDSNATSESAIIHTLESIDSSFTHAMLVQCTSPLTESSDFIKMIALLKEGVDSAAFYIEMFDYFFDFQEDYEYLMKERKPRQDWEPRKMEVGNAWLFDIKKFKKYKARMFGKIGICKIDKPKHLEIDDPEDLLLVEYLLKQREVTK